MQLNVPAHLNLRLTDWVMKAHGVQWSFQTWQPLTPVQPSYRVRTHATTTRCVVRLQHNMRLICQAVQPSINRIKHKCGAGVHTEHYSHLQVCVEPHWQTFGSSAATAKADLIRLAEWLGCRDKAHALPRPEALCLLRGAPAVLAAVELAGGVHALAAADMAAAACLGHCLMEAVDGTCCEWVPRDMSSRGEHLCALGTPHAVGCSCRDVQGRARLPQACLHSSAADTSPVGDRPSCQSPQQPAQQSGKWGVGNAELDKEVPRHVISACLHGSHYRPASHTASASSQRLMPMVPAAWISCMQNGSGCSC
jgi:hypothetical protein